MTLSLAGHEEDLRNSFRIGKESLPVFDQLFLGLKQRFHVLDQTGLEVGDSLELELVNLGLDGLGDGLEFLLATIDFGLPFHNLFVRNGYFVGASSQFHLSLVFSLRRQLLLSVQPQLVHFDPLVEDVLDRLDQSNVVLQQFCHVHEVRIDLLLVNLFNLLFRLCQLRQCTGKRSVLFTVPENRTTLGEGSGARCQFFPMMDQCVNACLQLLQLNVQVLDLLLLLIEPLKLIIWSINSTQYK